MRSQFPPTMRLSRLFFVFSLILAAGLSARAASSSADAPHLHVQLWPRKTSSIPQAAMTLGLYFKLEPGWHVYWKNAGDSGEPPHIRWTLPEGVAAGPLQFPAPKRLPLGPLMDFGYENEVLFPLKLQVASTVKDGPALLHAKVDWLVCREVCIPGKAELDLKLQLLSKAPPAATRSTLDVELFERLAGSLPKPQPASFKAAFQPSKEGFRLGVETGQKEKEAVFFPADQDILDNPAPQKLTATANGLILDLKKDSSLAANPAHLAGILELSGGRSFELTALPGAVAVPSLSWLLVLRTSGLAFLGGLLLNLMPCVFPVLFLKGLALVNSGHKEQHKLRAHGLVYALGILVSFWVLVAVLLGLRAAGSGLGWGFQFQSPVFLALMASLLFFLGLSLAGQFEIRPHPHQCRRFAGPEAGLHGQLLYRSAGGGGGHALHRSVHGSGHRLRAQRAARGHLCRLHGPGSGSCRPLCGPHPPTRLDASPAPSRSLDGSPAPSRFRAHLRHRYLAGLGAGSSLRRRHSCRAIGKLPAAGHRWLVPGPLAGPPLGHNRCRSHPACGGGAGRLQPEDGCQ